MNRYEAGGVTTVTNGFQTYWDRKIFATDISDFSYTIEVIYNNRPDKLAKAIYGDESLDWFILQYNNIIDPFNEFVTNKNIYLPTKERLIGSLLTNINQV